MAMEASIIMALISLLGTLILGILNSGKMSKADAVKLEHRLTVVEQNMFTREDHNLLIQLGERVENILSTLAQVMPTNLRNPESLDEILSHLSDKAAESWPSVVSYVQTDLSQNEREELLDYLEKQRTGRSAQRRVWAGIYLGMLRFELKLQPA